MGLWEKFKTNFSGEPTDSDQKIDPSLFYGDANSESKPKAHGETVSKNIKEQIGVGSTNYDEQPDESISYFNRALECISNSRFNDAIDNLNTFVSFKKDHSEAYFNLGLCHFSNGSAEKSIKYLKKSIDLKQECIEPYRLLGKVYKYLGRYEEAFLFSIKSISEIHNAGHNYFNNLNSSAPKYPKGYWKFVAEDFLVGAIISGQVVSVMEFGVFVELAEGVNGLLHYTDFPPNAPPTPSKFTRVGDYLDVEITKIDFEQERISISMNGNNSAADESVDSAVDEDDFLDQLTLTENNEPWQNAFETAETYYYGHGDEIQDYKEALKYYKKAADSGSNEAMLQLGVMYQNGEGCNKNTEKALDYFKEGVKFGNINCYAEMAKLFINIEHIENASKCWDKFFLSDSNDGRRDIAGHAFQYMLAIRYYGIEYKHKNKLLPYKMEIASSLERVKDVFLKDGNQESADSMNYYYNYLS